MNDLSKFASRDGAPLLWVERTSSTNTLAARLLRDPTVETPPFTTLIADAQLAGRGRLGRTWTSVPGRSLTASTLVRLPSTPALRDATAWVLIAAALSARHALAPRLDANHTVGIKWPNDVVIDATRKIAGLLGEIAEVDDHPQDPTAEALWLVIGLGVNVAMRPDERPTLLATALSLEGDAAASAEPRLVAQGILDAYLSGLRRGVDALVAHDGNARSAGLLDCARSHCVTLGHSVRVREPADAGPLTPGLERTPPTGIARDLLADGSLLVERADGSTRIVTAGDVEMVSSPDAHPPTAFPTTPQK